MLQKGKDVEIDGYKGFIFMAKSGRLLMPNAINNILYNIVDAYNRKEVQVAKTEHRNAESGDAFTGYNWRTPSGSR